MTVKPASQAKYENMKNILHLFNSKISARFNDYLLFHERNASLLFDPALDLKHKINQYQVLMWNSAGTATLAYILELACMTSVNE